jgi:transposase InsO family protein
LRATDVIDVLSDLFILRGVPAHIRSDNGPEFVAKRVQRWITAVGAKPATIEPGSLRWPSTGRWPAEPHMGFVLSSVHDQPR